MSTVRRGQAPAAAVAAVAVVAAVTLVAGAAGAGHAAGASVRMADGAPAWAAASADRGPVPAASTVTFDVVLRLPDRAAADRAVAAVSTPGSPTYRHFLTPAQFRAEYAPTAASVAAVRRWVTGSGMRVTAVAPSDMYVQVTGSAGQAERLLHVGLRRYAVDGALRRARDRAATVPAALAGTVAGFVGLDQDEAKPALALSGTRPAGPAATAVPTDGSTVYSNPPTGIRTGIQPCSSYYGQQPATALPQAYGNTVPYTVCGYGASQLQNAYGYAKTIKGGDDGSGVTVAVTDNYASPTMLADAQQWSAANGIPGFAAGQYAEDLSTSYTNNTTASDTDSWSQEETLDVEAVHAMAPGANVLYVSRSDADNGLLGAFSAVIDDHLASIMTDSWNYFVTDADASDLSTFFHQYLTEAAMTGVTVLFCTNDDGDDVAASGGTRRVFVPVGDPDVTGVGGTTTEIGKKNTIALQTGWENDYAPLSSDGTSWVNPPGTFASGSGGGDSALYDQPDYQVGVVPKAISEYASSTPMRAVPDISMDADPTTGLRIGETQTFPDGTYYDTYRLGGTSLASPLLAGVLADEEQAAGSPPGFINPTIYADRKKAVKDVGSVTDVATARVDYANGTDSSGGYTYRLQTMDIPLTISTRRGYDDVTGLGVPNGTKFLHALAGS